MEDALSSVLCEDLYEVGLVCAIFLEHVDTPGEGVVPVAAPVAGG